MHVHISNITNWLESHTNPSFLQQEKAATLSKKLIFFGGVLATTSAGYTFKASTLAVASSLPIIALVTGTILVIAGLYLYKNLALHSPVNQPSQSTQAAPQPIPIDDDQKPEVTQIPTTKSSQDHPEVNEESAQPEPEVSQVPTTELSQDNALPKDSISELISEGREHIKNENKEAFKSVLSQLCRMQEVQTLLNSLPSDIKKSSMLSLFIDLPNNENLFWKNASKLLDCLGINHYIRVNKFLRMNHV